MIIELIILGFVILAAVAVVVYLLGRIRDEKNAGKRLSANMAQLQREQAESKRLEDELIRKEEWSSILFNNVNDMVLVHGITEDGLPGRFLEANDAACSELEYTRDDLLSLTPLDIESVDTPAAASGYSRSDMVVLSDDYIRSREKKLATRSVHKLMERILREEQVFYERIYEARSGKKIPVEINARHFELMGRPVVMCTVKNISERKQAENVLSETKQRFGDFFKYSPIGIAMYDAERKLIDVNTACLKMFGIPDMEQFARFNLFDNPFLPDDARNKLGKGENVQYEVTLDFEEIRRQGLFISARRGEAYLDIMINSMGIDRNFRPLGYCGQIQDITERRKMEEELHKNEEQMHQAEKMEAIGSLAGGIAHDFNNIITPILGYAELTLATTSETEKVYKYMQKIAKAGHRAKDLVGQILTFCRKSDGEGAGALQPTWVTPIAKEVLTLKRADLPPEIEIRQEIKTKQDVVMADATKIHQVLMNLCTNAGHAMEKAGEGVLEFRMTDFVVDHRTRFKGEDSKLDPGRYLRISVKDSGTGMDEATVKRIFEPFFTTKEKGKGTGMGLSTVLGIVKSFKGTITVETELGKGTVFHVILPTIEKPAENQMTEKPSLDAGGTECVLIVDGDPDILEMEEQILSSCGYRPVSANTGIEARQMFQQNPEQFDIVVTESVLPGITGIELSKEILAIRPNVPIIVCTGYSEDFSEEDAKSIGIREFVPKPIVMNDLMTTIRRELDKGESGGKNSTTTD